MEKLLEMGKWKKTLFIICLFTGLIFLLFSEYDLMGADEEGRETFDENEYILHLETRLAEIIGKIEGISDVSVMVTLERGVEYQYAKETVGGLSSDGSLFQLQSGSDGTEKPILIATESPKVKGVSVVCRGAEGAVMQSKIISLIASTLNLNQNQIYVTT